MAKNLKSTPKPFDESSMRRIALRFKLFSTESRLTLMFCLVDGEAGKDELSKLMDCPITALNASLALLKTSGDLETRRDGLKVYYSLSAKARPLIVQCLNL